MILTKALTIQVTTAVLFYVLPVLIVVLIGGLIKLKLNK